MDAPNKRGRPPKGSESRKTKSVLLRLEESEKQAFVDAAEIAGVPLAVWMREKLRRAAVRELEEAGRKVPFVKWPRGDK